MTSQILSKSPNFRFGLLELMQSIDFVPGTYTKLDFILEKRGDVYMNGFTTDNIFIFLVALVLLILVIKFLKGVLKSIIVIILILTVGLSCYNIFVAKKSISYEANRYKTDFAYAMDIKGISVEASKVVDNIKRNIVMEEGITQLVDLRDKAELIPHSEEASFFHKRYIAAFDNIILACKGYALGEMAQEQVTNLEELTKGININILDVLNGN